PQAVGQGVGLAPSVAEERRPRRPAPQLAVELELEALDAAVVEVGASQDLAGGGTQRVLALGLVAHVDAGEGERADLLPQLGRHLARHPQETGSARQGAREDALIAAQQSAQLER